MTQAMQELLDILDLEQLEHNLYRGRSHKVSWQRVFGGQVVGQALVAAQRTVDDSRAVHSLHCYFMRPGDPQVPIIYQVDRLRDGVKVKGRPVHFTEGDADEPGRRYGKRHQDRQPQQRLPQPCAAS